MALPAYAVIPARYDSQRFPAKALADIDGVPMIVRVAQQAAKADAVDRVVVATDDDRIGRVVAEAGFEAVMTDKGCPSGTDRVAQAIQQFETAAGVVCNVQGDEPLIDPRDIDALVSAARAAPEAMHTLARPLPDPAMYRDPNAVKVVTTVDDRALYFSRAPIPFERGGSTPSARLHVGLYAYSPAVLTRFTQLPPSTLETIERLEQLRALENGIPIHVTMCVSERPSIGVDVPEDLDAVLRTLRRTNDQDDSSHVS